MTTIVRVKDFNEKDIFMKKLLMLFFITWALTCRAGVTIPATEIPYNVNYHWGIIDVMIAHGTVNIESDGTNFRGTLDGISIPWEGHVILVSDTLHTQMLPGNGLSNENVVYQSGWYRRPKVKYYRSNNYDASNPEFYKNLAGEGNYNASDDTMEAIAVTSDMIGMFYYAREFDFDNMKPGDKVRIPISGKAAKSKEVIVTYLGEGNYEVDNTTYPTHNIEFEYGYDGSPSGYQVQMKVGRENPIPMFISASLPVGKVEMLYNPD